MNACDHKWGAWRLRPAPKSRPARRRLQGTETHDANCLHCGKLCVRMRRTG